MTDLAADIAALLGAAPVNLRALHGGDLSAVYCADLSDGSRVAVKCGLRIGTEGRMLQHMADAGAPVPQVLAQKGSLLALGWITEGAECDAGWEDLGHALRHMHNQIGTEYAWCEDYAFGPALIHNQKATDWPSFWAQNRLLKMLPDQPYLAARVERLADDLHNRLPKHPPPSLLHGDLWTGNIMFAGKQAYLIDPACYWGDAEVDLAMLHLFGQPDTAFHASYGPLPSGWEARRPIYTLWPALVHLRLFGTGYRGLVSGLLDTCGV